MEVSPNPLLSIEYPYNSTLAIQYPGPLINHTLDPSLEGPRKTAIGSMEDKTVTITYSLKFANTLTAIFNIIKTFFTCVVLILGAYFSSLDIDTLVVEPLEGMISTVRSISENPLAAENLLAIREFKSK